MLRRTKAEVAKELPAKREHLLRCGLSPWQRKLYSHMREQGNLTVRPGETPAKGGGTGPVVPRFLSLVDGRGLMGM